MFCLEVLHGEFEIKYIYSADSGVRNEKQCNVHVFEIGLIVYTCIALKKKYNYKVQFPARKCVNLQILSYFYYYDNVLFDVLI